MDYPNAEQGAGVMNSKRAEKERANTAFGRLGTDPDAIRGGKAFAMMLEIIRADREKCSPDPAAITYWAKMFSDWIREPTKGRTLDELLELDGTVGASPVDVAVKRDIRDMRYFDWMGYLVGAGFTAPEAAAVVVTWGETNKLKIGGQKRLTEATLLDNFRNFGGSEYARKLGFFGDDPKIKAAREGILKSIPDHLLPSRFR